MSDLRTRIADAIKAADNDYAIDQTNAYLNLADAVIRELGLQRDDDYELGSYTPSGRHRYVTDWLQDD